MENKNLSDYTEQEFLSFLKDIYYDAYPSEAEHDEAILRFEELIEHPDGSDLIYYPNDDWEDSPEGILAEIKNGEPKMVSRGLRNK
ncbi:Colicin-E2 immunity protein [Yersinia aldovae ATCC 35236]|uniref:Colicin-E2 immunity protein n=1 Tax=Yersinia aldovae TaxID=29483 RepID=A0A0T9URR6_YERAL|nr:Colicin-E2 immunity protein [Yersinia aldovae ATCC 35236]CNJ90118.1 colicin-E2 immunity protein [Yersinia aldovae]CNL64739.1 colicin-E2 immunity protein [Yersinia aldovae]